MTDLTQERLAAIRGAASKATPGPWTAAASPSSIVGWPIVAQSGRTIASLNHISHSPIDPSVPGDRAFNAESKANGRYIAQCDPQTVSAMADEIERLRKERDQYKQWNEDNRDASVLSGICFDKAVKDRDTAQAENERLRAKVASLDDVLLGITEYWNGSNTEGAMSDALHEIIRRAETARNTLKRSEG